MRPDYPNGRIAVNPVGVHAQRLILVGVVTVGLLLRAWHWYYGRSLWIDEARVALNVLGRSFGDLVTPLWFDQSAPVLFLWATKLVVLLLGASDWTLRIIPVLCGMAALPLAYRLGRTFLSADAATLLAAIIAVSPVVVYYSTELKPYATDMALTLAIAGASVRSASRESPELRTSLLLAGVLGPWVSPGMFFVLPGCLLLFWLARARRVVEATVLWGSSALAAWLVTYRTLAENAYLDRFWSFRYWDPGPQWAARVWSSLIDVVGGVLLGAPPAPEQIEVWRVVVTVAALALAAVGTFRLVARHRSLAAVVVMPIVLLIVASSLRAYPIALRLTLFAVPLLMILFAAGIEQCVNLFRSTRLRHIVLLGLAVVIAGPAFLGAVERAIYPEAWAPVRTLVQAMKSGGESGQPVYVTAGMLPTWVHYTTDWPHVDTARLRAVARAASSGGYALENGGRAISSRRLEPPGVGAHGTTEIWGRSTGVEWISGFGFTYPSPYEDWASSEAQRVLALAQPRAWLVSTRMFGWELALHRAVRAVGLCEVLRVGDDRASAVLYERGRCTAGT